jgi:formylglycine-generating enzyme required for sulfatase activity/Mrp family chromosome partitioning ATPase
MTEGKATGRIITFYSYKGGTGRTMALANTAWVLASNGYRVLMIDWDLEAPGLHRYFHPFLTDSRLANTKGIIDFVFDYQRSMLALPEAEGARKFPDKWYDGRVDVFPYITELAWQQPGFGELHMLPAGQQGAEYGTRVNTFNWRQLYENLGGFEFFEAIKRQLVREYDYVLVDSRTGVSDTSGICTVQMPNALVVCFTLNSQSIEGAGEVALSVVEQRAAEYKEGELQVFPVPTRLEKAEKQKLDLARDAARTKFDTFLTRLPPADRDRYWGEVEIFYEPYYAYEEVLAAFADKPGTISSLLASIERLTARLTGGKVLEMQNIPPAKREEILAKYERRASVSTDSAARAAAIFRRLGTRQEEIARNVLLRLVAAGAGETAFRTAVATDDFTEQENGVVNRLVDEGVLSRKLAEDGHTEYVMIADERLIESWPTFRGWIQEQQAVIRIRGQLEQRAERWDSVGRKSDLLLSRRELPEAKTALLEAKSILPRVSSFVAASEKRARMRQWLIGSAKYAAISLVVVYLAFTYARPKIQTYLTLRSVRTKSYMDAQKYVWIPKGSFTMGCSYAANQSGCFSEQVELSSDFWMGQTEVTNRAYRSFLQAVHPEQLTAYKGNSFPENYPVSSVTWIDAVDYCSWVGGRLPSEAEWEYAARAGGRGKQYITGDTLVEKEISLGTAPKAVASFLPNAFGLFDMSGNVAEWTDDMANPFGISPISSSATSNRDPRRSPYQLLLRYRVGGVTIMSVRGGSYDSAKSGLQLDSSTSQYFNQPDPRTGFRCIVPASDLESVASNYQAFSALYGLYGRFYHGYNDPYNDWWYTLYLRQLKNADRK